MIDRYRASETAIVVGASSRIATAVAERFAADGANITVCSGERDNVEPVAGPIAFLASPASSFVVGETLTTARVPAIVETPDV